MDKFLGFVDFLLCVCHDQAMEILFLIAGVSGIGAALSLFDRAFTANSDFGLRFSFHFFERVATWSDE
jgi:hypothetical protein